MKLNNAKAVWIKNIKRVIFPDLDYVLIGYVSQNWMNGPERVLPESDEWSAHDLMDGTVLPRTYNNPHKAANAIRRKWSGSFGGAKR